MKNTKLIPFKRDESTAGGSRIPPTQRLCTLRIEKHHDFTRLLRGIALVSLRAEFDERTGEFVIVRDIDGQSVDREPSS